MPRPVLYAVIAALPLLAPAHAQPDAGPAPPPPGQPDPAPPQDGAEGDPAGAEADPEAEPAPPPTREELVERLADEDYHVRVSATDALLRDNTLDAPALRELLEQAADPERCRRLLVIAEHHLMRAIVARWTAENFPEQPDAAAVGFSYNPLLPDKNPHGSGAGLILLATMPGFPGYAYLKPGGVILEIDGRSSRSGTLESIRGWVRRAIGQHVDGGTVGLTVQRGEDTLDLLLPCGSNAALNELYLTTGSGGTIRRADTQRDFEAAYARLTEGLPEPEALTPQP